jgi:hypothetical protein
MFSVRYINFDYGHDGFSTLDIAVAHARRVGFEAAIYDDQHRLVATYNPFNGTKYIGVDDVD